MGSACSKISSSSTPVTAPAEPIVVIPSVQPAISRATTCYRTLLATESSQRENIPSLLCSSTIRKEVAKYIADINSSSVSSFAASLIELEVRFIKRSELHAQIAKAYAIFAWIANNVTYDVKAWDDLVYSIDTPNTSPDFVLATRSSICSGYANLFAAIAKEAGMEAVVIDGHFKTSRIHQPEGPHAQYTPSGFNTHAWNAVKLVGLWYLVDCTYAAGEISKTQFKKCFNPLYFAVPPEQMILTHWPEESSWQLLVTPLSLEQLQPMLPLTPDHFTQGLHFITMNSGTSVLSTSSGVKLSEMSECFIVDESILLHPIVELSLDLPENHLVHAELVEWQPVPSQDEHDHEAEHYVYLEQCGSQARFSVVVPDRGIFNLKLYTKFAQAAKMNEKWVHCATYLILCSLESDTYVGYPVVRQEVARGVEFSLLHWNQGTRTHKAECGTGKLELAFRAAPGTVFSHSICAGEEQYHYYTSLRLEENIHKLYVVFLTDGLWTVCLNVLNSLPDSSSSSPLLTYKVNVLKKTHKLSYPWIQSPRVRFPDGKPLTATGKDVLSIPFFVDDTLEFQSFLSQSNALDERMDQFVAISHDTKVDKKHVLQVVFPDAGKWLVQVYARPLGTHGGYTNFFSLFFEVESYLRSTVFPKVYEMASSHFNVKLLEDTPLILKGPLLSIAFEAPQSVFLQPELKLGWSKDCEDNGSLELKHCCMVYQGDSTSNRYSLKAVIPKPGQWSLILYGAPLADSLAHLELLFRVKIDASESHSDSLYPVLYPAFYNLSMSIPSRAVPLTKIIEQDTFFYSLSTNKQLEFKSMTYPIAAPDQKFSSQVLVQPKKRHQSTIDYHIEAVFPQKGDWIVQLFSAEVPTNYQPVIQFYIMCRSAVPNRAYPLLTAAFHSLFEMGIQEGVLPLLSRSNKVPTSLSIPFTRPSHVELKHLVIDEQGNPHMELTRIIPGEKPLRHLQVELVQRGQWVINLYARIESSKSSNDKNWTLVLEHQVLIVD